MIQEILAIVQEWLWTAKREMYWPGLDVAQGTFVFFLIYSSAAIASVLVLIGIYRAMRVWFHGKYEEEDQKFLSFFIGLIIRAFKNIFSLSFPKRLYYSIGLGISKRANRGKISFIAHLMIMFGFLGAIIATLIATAHEYLFHEELLVGPLYLIFAFFADVAGILLVMGTLLAVVRRYGIDRDYYERAGFEDLFLLFLLFWVGISGFFMEATRILYGLVNTPAFIEFEIFSIMGYPLALGLQSLLSPNNDLILSLHFLFYLSHLLVAFIGAVYLTRGKFFHIGIGLANIILSDMKSPAGQLQFDLEGIKTIEDFTVMQLIETSACMKCHFCHNYCPAQDSSEPLSPLKVVQDIKNWGKKQYGLTNSHKKVPIIGEESGINGDVLWACVTCYACVNACPHLIGHVDMIVGMRATLIEEGEIPTTFTTMLESAYNYGNIWNQPKQDRVKWLKEGSIPSIKESESKILWLPGDTLAYDPRNQKAARAFLKVGQVFLKAGMDFGTLGAAEKNDGNDIRRLGEEALFQMLAEDNIRMFKKNQVKQIITSSPHAYNTIKNEYPEYGGEFDVVHYTEVIASLIEEGTLKFTKNLNYEVTYHDPCYLGRYNDIYDAPRKIIEALPGVTFKEMPNHGQFSYCCGGGGGGMFRETPEWVETRISETRVLEAEKTLGTKNNAKKVIITACPYCTSMLTDALKTQQLEEEIEVKDIIELVQEAMGD
ncbi:MAG: heterodisulfide reductase-related iron-sulfur binding cluster [Candidatus Hodarchaeales archaeon]|jgi:Fe-S oxidoreductase